MTTDEAGAKRFHGGSETTKLYSYFRAVGRVADGIPASVNYMGGVPYAESLNVTFSSSELDSKILRLCGKDEYTYVLTENNIHLFNRARLQHSVSLESCNVVASFVLGGCLAVLYTERLSFYELPSLAIQNSVDFDGTSEATCFVHPATYLNKVLVGFADGHLELWNTNSSKLVFSFPAFESQVTLLCTAPALDVVAVGLKNGTVWLMDIRKNKRLFSLCHSAAISGIAFRTDINDESQIAVGLENGTVVLWDLESRKIHSTWTAHESVSVATVQFIQSQPILITTGNDNAIREWIIEGADLRMLRSRSGHSKPSKLVRFYSDGEAILSAGGDKSFRSISMIKDSQSVEMSQGSIESISRRAQVSAEDLKLDPIIGFDFFSTSDLKWDNVVTAHEKSPIARTWRADHRKLGSHELRSADNSSITSVTMSSCGNFAIIGTLTGCVDVFNVQSGQHRKHFTGPSFPVIGLGVDAANQYIVQVYSDGTINCTELCNGRTKFSFKLEHTVSKVSFCSEAELLMVALSNHEIQIFDVLGRTIVRRFVGHSLQITDVVFSQDGRWVISASEDLSIRTWDMATGLQLDVHELPSVPVSISLSPKLDFLAVALEGDVAVHIWTNVSMYKPVVFQQFQNHSLSAIESVVDEALLGLVNLSLEPRSKSVNLFHLDSIKARNKPVLPPKATERVPFFLDALLGSSGNQKRDASGAKKNETDDSPSGNHLELCLAGLLRSEKGQDQAFDYLKSLGPSTIDLEIQSLVANSSVELDSILKLIRVITQKIEQRADYELAVTFLNTVLKAHAHLISSYPSEFHSALQNARDTLRSTWSNLETLFHESLCLTQFARGN
ncbi:hypothetical protein PSACC_02930 [Paramicrosporidium saccamoebae]|uniref:Uncharacterized protein n=1 Tax=Paramicrosporidium saccamoebae TaxID=1246581 RepID=A0A2H9THQ4_9FUNG|nr:hypothetical protein PSACC_02930 [Paramicrosporidium saccamoebae]